MLSLPLSYAHVLNHTEIYIETIVLCFPLEMLVPSLSIFLLSNLPTTTKPHPIRLTLYFEIYFSQCQQCCTLHAMTSAPLSPTLPRFLHVAASRSRACWILLAPTYQLLTLPCPLEFHPPFSGTTWCLDTPAVGSPMMTRACWIRLAPTHQLSTLPCPLELQPPSSETTRTLPGPHWAVP